MGELDYRLMRCISSVFPAMTDEEIRTVNVAQLMDVDSLAAVTLLALIDEEFGVDMDLEDLLKLGDFQAVQQSLHEHGLATDLADNQRMK